MQAAVTTSLEASGEPGSHQAPPPSANIPHVEILGVRVHAFTITTLHDCIARVIGRSGKSIVANVNVHALNLADQNVDFRRALQKADYVFCDGAGVRLAARLLGQSLPARITYADWLPQLAAFCRDRGFRLFLLGARSGVAEQAAQTLQKQCPGLIVAGCQDGFFDKSHDSAQNREIIERINRANTHILLVCFGMPVQELWLARNWASLNVHIGLTGGAALDYISGGLQRPPSWLTRNGFEWLGRLWIEPGRLWKRYLIGNPLFLLRLVRCYFLDRKRGDQND